MADHTTKGGNVVLNGLHFPEQSEPGQTTRAEIGVINGATYINPLDPDFCGGGGYRLRAILVHPDGFEQPSEWTCLPSTTIGTRGETFELSFTAPETVGDHQYEAYVEMEGSRKTTGRLSRQLTVNEGDVSNPDDEDDEDDGDYYQFPWEDGNDDDENSFTEFPDVENPLSANVKLIVVLIIIILALGWMS
jgi:hypothetical protein